MYDVCVHVHCTCMYKLCIPLCVRSSVYKYMYFCCITIQMIRLLAAIIRQHQQGTGEIPEEKHVPPVVVQPQFEQPQEQSLVQKEEERETSASTETGTRGGSSIVTYSIYIYIVELLYSALISELAEKLMFWLAMMYCNTLFYHHSY